MHAQCVDALGDGFVTICKCICVSSIHERKYSPEKRATMQLEMLSDLMLDKKNGNNLCFISYFILFSNHLTDFISVSGN